MSEGANGVSLPDMVSVATDEVREVGPPLPVETTATKSDALKASAPKKTKLMLTDEERIVFEHCSKTGDTPTEALYRDSDLIEAVMKNFEEKLRLPRIQERLERDVSWLKQNLSKLKAGVREPCDEPTDGEPSA